jgi:hypothetical protein
MALRRTTIGEQGPKLPIGTLQGNQLVKDFQLRPYKSRIDRALGDWLEANQSKYSSAPVLEAAKVAKFCSLICAQLGSRAMALTTDGDSPPEAEVGMYSAWYADVMYLYVFARIQALGPQLEVNFVCPACNQPAKGIYDLNTMEVDVIDDAADLSSWAQLQRPIRDRNGKKVSKLKLRPITWATMLKPGVFSGVMDQITQAGLEDCICGTDATEGESMLTQGEIDDLERIDIVGLNHQTQNLAAGLELKTSVTCPHVDTTTEKPCGYTDEDAMNWTFDYFFGSSLPISATASS